MGVIICVGRVGKCMEEKYTRRSGGRSVRIQNSREIFSRYIKGIQ